MKLDEIFDANYYDHIQDEMRGKKGDEDAEIAHNDSASSTSIGDFIVSAYEVDEIPFEQAEKQLQSQLAHDKIELQFWLRELDAAQAVKE